MRTIEKPITKLELKKIAQERFGHFVKAVVDIEKKIMVIDADLHADEEALLLAEGSRQQNLWGINLYPDLSDEEWIEFDSMINVRPSQGNRGRGVDDEHIQKKIIAIVKHLIIS